ncbi:MAG: hypothetical protein KatS3mg101_0860 [Patescibacteria group bacterium]|nr:MAG: hypothetical protein KatS3mg101_0860 [Patescibacteria group bacterium]
MAGESSINTRPNSKARYRISLEEIAERELDFRCVYHTRTNMYIEYIVDKTMKYESGINDLKELEGELIGEVEEILTKAGRDTRTVEVFRSRVIKAITILGDRLRQYRVKITIEYKGWKITIEF